jgi:hypothetical protein
MMSDAVAVYEVQLRDFDAKLAPLGDRIPDVSQPDWREKLANLSTALDELGVRMEAINTLTAVAQLYARAPDVRGRVRDMFIRCRHVRGALWPHDAPTSRERLLPWLLGISMRDVGDNPQEMPQILTHVCEMAAASGVNPVLMLGSIGVISGESLREVILAARNRMVLARAALS